jgi:hypothetical protein
MTRKGNTAAGRDEFLRQVQESLRKIVRAVMQEVLDAEIADPLWADLPTALD